MAEQSSVKLTAGLGPSQRRWLGLTVKHTSAYRNGMKHRQVLRDMLIIAAVFSTRRSEVTHLERHGMNLWTRTTRLDEDA